jgi:hypothetical protein
MLIIYCEPCSYFTVSHAHLLVEQYPYCSNIWYMYTYHVREYTIYQASRETRVDVRIAA